MKTMSLFKFWFQSRLSQSYRIPKIPDNPGTRILINSGVYSLLLLIMLLLLIKFVANHIGVISYQ